MTTLQVINKISESPEIKIVVVSDMEDKNPMEAISFLSAMNDNGEEWEINTSLEKGIMLIFGGSIKLYE